MDQSYVLIVMTAVAVISLCLTAALVLLLVRKGSGLGPELAAEKARVEAELAVFKERAARAESLEADLSEVRAAREKADQEVSALREAKSRLEADEVKSAAEIERLRKALDEEAGQLSALKAELAALRETLQQERRQADDKLKILLEAKETMTREFQVLANDVMGKHGESFTKQNKEQLDVLLTPLRDKLKEFQEGLQKAHEDTGKERATLAEQIRGLSEQSARMTSETVNLTRALKGSAQMQGAWGEMILETLLEKSGLRDGEEYVRQASHNTEDGARLRTDVIVNLPGGQHVIIDSKVSTVAFEAYVNAETEEERALHLEGHLASMRTHIKGLAAKEYHSATGGLDCAFQ